VLIISGNLLNGHAPVLICCPLNTSLKHYKGNPVLEPSNHNGLKKSSEVMEMHVRSIAKERLKKSWMKCRPQYCGISDKHLMISSPINGETGNRAWVS
jgi:mRNA-degrading endonuclease toxin of MazEF toxin-antitoxin module